MTVFLNIWPVKNFDWTIFEPVKKWPTILQAFILQIFIPIPILQFCKLPFSNDKYYLNITLLGAK